MPQYLHLALFCFILFCCLIFYSSFTWASCHFKSLATPPTACWTICSSVYQIKHQSSICITGPLCGESIDDWWFALTKGVSNAENVSISQCHHVLLESYDLFTLTLLQDLFVDTARGYDTVYPKKYAHGFVVLCFVVVMQSFVMNSHEVFIHIHQGCFAGTGAIVRLPQCQWSKPDGYGKISHCITTTKHSKAKTVCIFLGIYCMVTLVGMQ